VALVDFTMQDPFRHCSSRAAHEADAVFHGSSERSVAERRAGAKNKQRASKVSIESAIKGYALR